jgi:ketosteroid isomerase-like protein
MSQGNVEIVRRMYEAFYGGDAEGALAYFDPEVEVDASARVDGGIVHGRQELSALIAGWQGAWNDWREEIEAVRDLGSRVLVAAAQRGRSKGSGIEVETRYAVVYEVHGDKITRMTMYSKPEEALEAVGVRE